MSFVVIYYSRAKIFLNVRDTEPLSPKSGKCLRRRQAVQIKIQGYFWMEIAQFLDSVVIVCCFRALVAVHIYISE